MRTWRIRGGLLRTAGEQAEAELRAFWPVDVSNYRFTRIAAQAGAAATAVEVGDRQVAEAMLDALDRLHPLVVRGGVGHRRHASLWAHAFELIARTGRENGLRDIVGRPARTGSVDFRPRIASRPYPDALVVKAAQAPGALAAVLIPGKAHDRVEIGLTGLRPLASRRRNETGETFMSDATGEARIGIALVGKTDVTIREGCA